MNENELTNKILQSGFIEAFFEQYEIERNLILSYEDRLNYALELSEKDKIKRTKKIIKKAIQNIKELGHNNLSADILSDKNIRNSNLIEAVSNYYIRLVESLTPVNSFVENYDGRCSLQLFYEEFYDVEFQPNIKDVNEILEEESNLIELIVSYIDDFKENNNWDIDISNLNYFVEYSIEISQLFNLAELYFQISRYFNFKGLLDEVSVKVKIDKSEINEKKSFSKTLENFFIQTNYCLALNPETVLLSEKGNISLLLEPQQFFKFISDYQIDCPFVIDEKIHELKNLMIKENISFEYGISIFESYKNYHNAIDGVIIFKPILDLLSKGLKRLNPLITEKEITKEVNSLNKYYEDIKKDFHNKLYYGLFEKKSITVTENIKVIDDIKKYKKIPVKYYVLTYILDCRANNKKIESKKSSLIIIGNELLKEEKTKGATFYRVFNDYSNIIKNIIDDKQTSKKISTDFDFDWKDIVLELSKNPDELEKFIFEKKIV